MLLFEPVIYFESIVINFLQLRVGVLYTPSNSQLNTVSGAEFYCGIPVLFELRLSRFGVWN